MSDYKIYVGVRARSPHTKFQKVRVSASVRIVDALDLSATLPDAIYGAEVHRCDVKTDDGSSSMASGTHDIDAGKSARDFNLSISEDDIKECSEHNRLAVIDINISISARRSGETQVSTAHVVGAVGNMIFGSPLQGGSPPAALLEARRTGIDSTVVCSSSIGRYNFRPKNLGHWGKDLELDIGVPWFVDDDNDKSMDYFFGCILDDNYANLIKVMKNASRQARLPLPMRVTLDTWLAWVAVFVMGQRVVPFGRQSPIMETYNLATSYATGEVVHLPEGMGRLIDANSTAGSILLNVRKSKSGGHVVGMLDDLLLEALDKHFKGESFSINPSLPDTLEEQAHKLEMIVWRYRNAATMLRASPNVVKDTIFRDILFGKDGDDGDNEQSGSDQSA